MRYALKERYIIIINEKVNPYFSTINYSYTHSLNYLYNLQINYV